MLLKLYRARVDREFGASSGIAASDWSFDPIGAHSVEASGGGAYGKAGVSGSCAAWTFEVPDGSTVEGNDYNDKLFFFPGEKVGLTANELRSTDDSRVRLVKRQRA